MDPKLAMLFMLIGGIVTLSRLSERPTAQRVRRIWRVAIWRRG